MGYYYYLYLKKARHREIKKIPKVTQLKMQSLKVNPGGLNLGSVLTRTGLHASPGSGSRMRAGKFWTVRGIPPRIVLVNDGDFPRILQNQSGPGSQSPSVHALSLCPLPTDHPSSPPTLFSLRGAISSGGLCLPPWRPRAIGRPTRDAAARGPSRAWESLEQVAHTGEGSGAANQSEGAQTHTVCI